MKRKKHYLAEKSYLGVQSKNRESWLGGKTSKAAAVKRCITQVQFGCNRKSSPNPFRGNQRCRPSRHLGRTQDVGSLGMTDFTHNTPQKCKDLLICNSCCYRVFYFDFTNLLNSFKPFGLRKMTSQYRVADSKREEFRKYLEKAGVMDALTKVLVNLYEEPEKPANALEYPL